jgi:hypothetical protein
LHELIKKEQNFQAWEWPLEAMDAFQQLKDCLVTAPVLAFPEPGNEEFLIHSDASNLAVGAVLLQWQQDSMGRRQQRVFGYFSRKLTATECKYATYDRELMAIRDALQSWRFFVQGKYVDICTDHRALKRILKQRTLSSRQFNTLMDLNHFHYDIRYNPGAKNVVADRLSRRADHNTIQAALLVTEITDAGQMSEDKAQQEDHEQQDHVQQDHGQEDYGQQDHGQEDHVQQGQVQQDHVQQDHGQEDHGQQDHRQEDHVQEDHVQQDHVQQDHVQEDHVQEDHVPENHVIQDEAVEWLEEVRLAYRTDPFTAVISDLINAGANNGAEARALPASVQRELSAKHSEQRIQHARSQLPRFKFNANGILQSGGRLVVPKGRR